MRIPYVAELSLPRCMKEKKLHAQVVNKIPFDMIDAWKERMNQLSASRTKLMPPEFNEIIDRNSTSDKDLCLSSLLQHSVQKKIDSRDDNVKKLDYFSEIIRELMPKWTPAEAGMVLRCLMKLGYVDVTIYNNLLQIISNRRQQFSIHASIVALDLIYAETKFKNFTTPVIDKIKANVNSPRNIVEMTKLALGLSNFMNMSQGSSIVNIIKKLMINIINNNQLLNLDIGIISTLATVMSRTRLLSSKLMQIIYKKIETDSDNFTLDNCAVFANCIAQLGHARISGTIKYFEILGDVSVKRESQMNGRLAAVLINAFAKAHVMHQDLFTLVSKKLLDICSQLESRQIAMIAHAFAKLGHLQNINVIWDLITNMQGYNWQELAMLLQAYTKSGGSDINFINNICKALCKQFTNTTHTPTGLVNTAYSLYKVRNLVLEESNKLLVMIAQKTVTMLNKFKPTELANMCLALSISNPASKIITPHLKTLVIRDIDSDSIFKLVKFYSEIAESDNMNTLDVDWCSKLVKNNAHKMINLPISHKLTLKTSLAKLGIFDKDLECIISGTINE